MFLHPRRCGGLKAFLLAASGASLLVAASPRIAHAQFTTSGVYDENVVETGTVNVIATGSAYASVAAFQTVINAAFLGNTGGVIGFDNLAAFNPGASFTATYGTGAANTLTVTSPNTAITNYSVGLGASTTYGALSGAVVGGSTYYNYIGNTVAATTLAGTSTQVYQNLYQFNKGLSTVGFTVVARGSARALNFLTNFSDGTSTTLTAAQGINDYVFFNVNAPTNRTISSINVYSPDGFIRMDDLAFVVGSTSAPEPGSVALALPGMAVLGMVVRCRRGKRFRPSDGSYSIFVYC